jgi:hypothetical protein
VAGGARLLRPGLPGAKVVAAWGHRRKQAGGAQRVQGLERLEAWQRTAAAQAAYQRVLA